MSEITIRQARNEGAQLLASAGIESAALDARLLLAHTIGLTQTGLLISDPDPISRADLGRYREIVGRRATGVPLAYLTGHREFMGLTFLTTPDVLVPRPDTEPLVEWGLNWISQHPHANLADIGTGSGAIAIAMTHHAPGNWTGHTIAIDISAAALAIARTNADVLVSPARRSLVTFVPGSLTEPLTAPVDLLLTNLPYLTPDQIAGNPDLSHEPIVALDGGADGLDLIRKVMDDLPRVLAPGGAVGLEIDPSQSAEVQHLLQNSLPGHRVEIVFDLAGDERHIVAF